MMLMASLALLSGATGRIPWVNAIFGFHTWVALFGPVVAVGGVLLVVRSLLTRGIDREFAVGYASLAAASVVAASLAGTDVRVNWAGVILKF